MASTALITGASSGIGRAFALHHASVGGDVIVAARRVEALETLKTEIESQYRVTAHVFQSDLAAPDAPQKLFDAIKAAGLSVDILINNAGLGGHGTFVDRNLADEQAMIDLNVKALVALSHLFGADMAARDAGRILNVGSTAGFMPGPQQAIYFATKAFVNSFSQALDQELRPKGVTCTVLAPGYVHTEFAHVAKLDGTDLVSQKGRTAEFTAKVGYDAMMKGQLVVVNEPQLSVAVNWLIPLLPRRMVLKMVDKMQSK
ncbi:MAG: SDR family oxidoreductase [Pseudomonadota bacterium]